MDKILVSVYVPAIAERYEVCIPKHLEVSEVVKLIREGVCQLSGDKYLSSEHELLCHKDRGTVLSNNTIFGDYIIKNGDNLVLI